MSDLRTDYGLLIGKDIKLHRTWFKQMTALHGINCKYRAPLQNKEYDVHADLQTGYKPEIIVGCLFEEHPNQKSLKKAGWAYSSSSARTRSAIGYIFLSSRSLYVPKILSKSPIQYYLLQFFILLPK